MATIMTWGNSEGIQGRCDAKCHTAEKPECDCMCNGRFHGSAVDETLEEKLGEASKEFLESLAAEGKIHPVQSSLDMFRDIQTPDKI